MTVLRNTSVEIVEASNHAPTRCGACAGLVRAGTNPIRVVDGVAFHTACFERRAAVAVPPPDQKPLAGATRVATYSKPGLEGGPTTEEINLGVGDWQVAGELLLRRAKAIAGPDPAADFYQAQREYPQLAASYSERRIPVVVGIGQDLTAQECDEMIARRTREYRAADRALTEHDAQKLVLEDRWLKEQYARSRG